MASFDEDYRRLLGTTVAPPVKNPLKDTYWLLPVSTLVELAADEWVPTEPWKERHRIYSSLLMALVHHYWNGYKYGRPRPDWVYQLNDPLPFDGQYFGHNIAALAVDDLGFILDFEFNHNDLFNSSAEHAEARLVRRLYSHAQISDSWGAIPQPPPPAKEGETHYAALKGGGSSYLRGRERRRIAAEILGNSAPASGSMDALSKEDDVRRQNLKGVTIYTSLESCAQCAGVMGLAKIREVIYLETDPQFFFIGRILRNLTTEKLRAPRPISGAEIDLDAFADLDREFKSYSDDQTNEKKDAAFMKRGDKEWWSDSVTSFLCTSAARKIFSRGESRIGAPLAHPKVALTRPDDRPDQRPRLWNEHVVIEAKDFLEYAKNKGFRATPHNL